MPFRLSDQRRIQSAFDAVLEETIYEAEVKISPDRNQVICIVRDPDKPQLMVCNCAFTFNAHRSQKTKLQPSNEELQQMAQSFAALCQVYVSPADPVPEPEASPE